MNFFIPTPDADPNGIIDHWIAIEDDEHTIQCLKILKKYYRITHSIDDWIEEDEMIDILCNELQVPNNFLFKRKIFKIMKKFHLHNEYNKEKQRRYYYGLIKKINIH